MRYTEEKFNNLKIKDKRFYIDKLMDMGFELSEHEFKAASSKQKIQSINLKIKKADWLEDYEFNAATPFQKEKYIYRKRFLSQAEFLRLDEDLKIIYIEYSVYTKMGLDKEGFLSLSEKHKKYYANFKFEFPLNLEPNKISYLTKHNQKVFVSKIIEQGNIIDDKILKELPKDIQKFYEKTKKDFSKCTHNPRKTFSEARKIVQQVLQEIIFRQ